jgi:glycosyltransferase involved in cell wall biosynthesis
MPVDFSVIIPSRNRPVLLRQAIDSVLGQTHGSVEVIVVNDGSSGDNAGEYSRLTQKLSDRVRLIDLVYTPTGHGQSYAINIGAAQAIGSHLCFLDDDDSWTDMHHLARAAEIIRGTGGNVDVYLANQSACFNDEQVQLGGWLGKLLEQVKRPLSADRFGAYRVTVADLMHCSGFEHLNVTIVRRELFERIGGMDHDIRYECDRDFYLRMIDTASTMIYVPNIVSRHNIPDPRAKSSMSTAISDLEKYLYQLRVLDKAILFAEHQDIRAHARKHKGYVLKHLAEALYNAHDYPKAAYYAREALLISFSFKWLAFTSYLRLTRAFSGLTLENKA